MFSKKMSVERTSFNILIGSQSSVNGDLQSKGAIRIDGSVKGDVISDSKIIISTEATVTGDVKGSNVDLSGTVTGDVNSSGHLKVHPTGVLKGNIQVASFVIEEGGVFEGSCHIDASLFGQQEAESQSDTANRTWSSSDEEDPYETSA